MLKICFQTQFSPCFNGGFFPSETILRGLQVFHSDSFDRAFHILFLFQLHQSNNLFWDCQNNRFSDSPATSHLHDKRKFLTQQDSPLTFKHAYVIKGFLNKKSVKNFYTRKNDTNSLLCHIVCLHAFLKAERIYRQRGKNCN